ncbi:MAG: AAA family ATPase [Fibrobacterales bacterium]
MERFAQTTLDQWFSQNKRKPLIIRGARQVGKSTLVRLYCKEKTVPLFEINLERHPELKSVFKTMDTPYILQELELVIGKGSIRSSKGILFIDEIQSLPEAITFLRYVYEEYPDIAVIAAGSLLEFSLSQSEFSMPVGRVHYLWLGPMTFNEFLIANSHADLLKYKRDHDLSTPFSPTVHNRLVKHLREFYLVGGMPESISDFVEQQHISQEFSALDSIIYSYRDDFSKYAKGASFTRVQKVFDYLCTGIGQKLKYVNVSKEDKSKDINYAFHLLQMAQVLNLVHHTSSNSLPLAGEKNEKVIKPFTLDIGLFHFMSGIKNISIDSMLNTQGVASEQFIAQHLLYLNGIHKKPELYYWLRESKSANAEIDFIISIENTIVPVEVKSQKSGSLKSLHQFCYEKKCSFAIRFDLNPPTLQNVDVTIHTKEGLQKVTYTLLSLPLYMVEELLMLAPKLNTFG